MRVIAVSSQSAPSWRWQIVSNAGRIVEESRTTFSTMRAATAEGARRLVRIDATDTIVRRDRRAPRPRASRI